MIFSLRFSKNNLKIMKMSSFLIHFSDVPDKKSRFSKEKNVFFIFVFFCTLEIVSTCSSPNMSSKLHWEPFENLRTLFFNQNISFEHIWLHFGAYLDRISRILMDFSEIVPSSTCSFSMTTGRISKSFFIKHIYSTRYVDCAVFRVVWGTPGGRLEPMNSSTKPVFDSDIPNNVMRSRLIRHLFLPVDC